MLQLIRKLIRSHPQLKTPLNGATMNDTKTKTNKKALIKLLVFSVLIDWGVFAALAPILMLLPGSYLIEEIIEQFISTFLAKLFKDANIQLSWIDRIIGALPAPGITPITIAIVRRLLFTKNSRSN